MGEKCACSRKKEGRKGNDILNMNKHTAEAITTQCVAVGEKRIPERTHTNRHLAKMIEDIFSRALRETRWEKTILWHCICDAENPQSRTTHHKVPSPSHNTKKSKPFSRYCKSSSSSFAYILKIYRKKHQHKKHESVVSEKHRVVRPRLHRRAHFGRLSGDFSPSLHCVSFVRLRTIFVGKENFSVSIFHIFSFFSPVHFVNSSLTHDVPTGSIADFHSFWPRIKSRIKWLLQSLSMDNRVGF